DPIGLRERQRPEQDGMHDREDRRVRADAERERREGDGREAGASGERARRAAQILEEVHGADPKQVWPFPSFPSDGRRPRPRGGRAVDFPRNLRMKKVVLLALAGVALVFGYRAWAARGPFQAYEGFAEAWVVGDETRAGQYADEKVVRHAL